MRLAFLILLALAASTLADPLFVAVGYGGRRIASRDGFTWKHDQRWSDTTADDDNVLFNIAYGAGQFVAVGGGATNGRIVTTRDGEHWTELPALKGRVATIAYGRDRFVAAHGSELLLSTDGATFTRGAKLDWPGSFHPRRSAFGDTEAGRIFVIIGDADFFGETQRAGWRAATTDGVAFSKAEHHTPVCRDIAYGAGHFVAIGPVGLIETSHDGQTWQRVPDIPPTENFDRIVWTGQRFLVSGGKTAWASVDALAWAPLPTAIPSNISWASEPSPFPHPLEPSPLLAFGFSWGGHLHVSTNLPVWKRLPIAPGPSLESLAFRP